MINWTENWDAALSQSTESKKPIFLFLHAEG